VTIFSKKKLTNKSILAIEEADAIIFMVDVLMESLEWMKLWLKLLRRSQKPIFLAINKVDNALHRKIP